MRIVHGNHEVDALKGESHRAGEDHPIRPYEFWGGFGSKTWGDPTL